MGQQAPCAQPTSIEEAAGAAQCGQLYARSCRVLTRKQSDTLVDMSSVQLVLRVQDPCKGAGAESKA